MTERREYVENRETWQKEYGTYTSMMSAMGGHVAFMQRYVPGLETEPLRVLDIGCAYGYYLRFLKQYNPRLELYGVELARHAVTAAEQIAGNGHVFWQSCGEHIPLPDASVDMIYCFEMIEHVADFRELDAMAAEMARLLKPEGKVFVQTPNYNARMQLLLRLTGQGHWLKYDHCNLFNEAKLRSFLEPHLHIERLGPLEPFDLGPYVPFLKGIYSLRFRISGQLMAVCRRKDAGSG